MGNAGLFLDVLLDLSCEGFRVSDVRARWQKNVHHELRSIRAREESLLDPRKAEKRCDEQHDTNNDRRPTKAERLNQEASVEAEEKAAIWILAFYAGLALDRFEHQVTQKRRDRDRRNPAETKGNQNDPEERIGNLSACVLRQANRRECKYPNGCGAEQRPLVLRNRVAH